MSSILLVFAKAPVAGQVKTRLLPVFSPEQAAELHRRLLRATVEVACSSGLTVLLCGGSASEELMQLGKSQSVEVCWQRGDDLGQRMFNAASDALKQCDSVIIIGSDCPEMTGEQLQQADQQLQHDDVVLIPATDGGYVLIGFARRVEQSVFAGVDWGSENVLQQTRDNLRQAGLSWFELAPLADLDRPEDLDRIRHKKPELLDGLG